MRIDDAGGQITAPGCRILVVDDMPTNLAIAKGLLSRYQVTVTTASDGHEAVELALASDFDIVIIDHMMPGMDGVATAKAIRGLGARYASTPLVALTGSGDAATEAMLRSNGFDSFLAKPLDRNKLNGMFTELAALLAAPSGKEEPAPQREPRQAEAANFEIEGLDKAIGIQRIGGSERYYLDALKIFRMDTKAKLASLGALSDVSCSMMIVHALKGSLANIGALALSDEAAALEVACKDGGTDAWYRMESFTDGLRELLSRIEAALSGTEANSPPGAEFPPAETLMRLKDALVKRNIGVIDALLEELTQPRYGRGVTDALSSVSERVLMSDFDEAAGIVAGLLKEAAK